MRVGILHTGIERRLFGYFPEHLSKLLEIPLTEDDAQLDFAYVLGFPASLRPRCPTFIPFDAMVIAQDKRSQARAFAHAGVPTPETHVLEDELALRAHTSAHPDRQWVLKWPTGCGGMGHQMLDDHTQVTRFWSPPFLVQAFIPTDPLVVYRTFAVRGDIFGFFIRRFPEARAPSPWVNLENGAVAHDCGEIPSEAADVARRALSATHLIDSFGCVDLLLSTSGQWLVLEVNTDGLSSFTTREFGFPAFSRMLDERLHAAFDDACKRITEGIV